MDGSAVAPDDMYYKHGVKRIRRTTKGWVLLLQWKDGSTTWFPLKDLKESNPIEVPNMPLLTNCFMSQLLLGGYQTYCRNVIVLFQR
jgi:hypothetical protein